MGYVAVARVTNGFEVRLLLWETLLLNSLFHTLATEDRYPPFFKHVSRSINTTSESGVVYPHN